jgi:hypothetical protein
VWRSWRCRPSRRLATTPIVSLHTSQATVTQWTQADTLGGKVANASAKVRRVTLYDSLDGSANCLVTTLKLTAKGTFSFSFYNGNAGTHSYSVRYKVAGVSHWSTHVTVVVTP